MADLPFWKRHAAENAAAAAAAVSPTPNGDQDTIPLAVGTTGSAPGDASSSSRSSNSSKGRGRGLSSSLAARARLFDQSAGGSGEGVGGLSSPLTPTDTTTSNSVFSGGDDPSSASSSSSTRERARRHAARLALNAKMAAAFNNQRYLPTQDQDNDHDPNNNNNNRDGQESALAGRLANANPNGIAAARAMFANKPNTVPKTPDMLGSGFLSHPVVNSKSFHTATIGNASLPAEGEGEAGEATASDDRLLSLVLDDPENSPLLYIEVGVHIYILFWHKITILLILQPSSDIASRTDVFYLLTHLLTLPLTHPLSLSVPSLP